MTDAFTRLLAGVDSEKHRERLHNLRHELKLPGDDPVWALLAVVEDYCRSLLERRRSSAAESAPARGWRPVLLFAIGSAVATALMTTAYLAGFHAAGTGHSSWLVNAPHSWPEALLTVPAGWMLFVETLPLFACVAVRGWRARRAYPAIGWTLIGTSTTAAFVLAGTLAWLMAT